jgi:hypothetical protein
VLVIVRLTVAKAHWRRQHASARWGGGVIEPNRGNPGGVRPRSARDPQLRGCSAVSGAVGTARTRNPSPGHLRKAKLASRRVTWCELGRLWNRSESWPPPQGSRRVSRLNSPWRLLPRYGWLGQGTRVLITGARSQAALLRSGSNCICHAFSSHSGM